MTDRGFPPESQTNNAAIINPPMPPIPAIVLPRPDPRLSSTLLLERLPSSFIFRVFKVQ